MDPQDDLNEGFSGGHGADDDDDHIFESCDNKIQNASWADHIAPANLAPIRTRRLDPQDDEDEAAEVGEYDDDDDDDDDDESGNSMAMEGVVRNGGHIIIHASASASASVAAPALPPQEETAPNTNSAKFKSKMPPKIPIPRSPYITIPPGLSPTMLLQSPVLLPSAQVRCLHLFCVYISVFSFWCCWVQSELLSHGYVYVCLFFI